MPAAGRSSARPRARPSRCCPGALKLRRVSIKKHPRHGVARVISKLGLGSRTQAAAWVREGRVRVNGRLVSDPETAVHQGVDVVSVDGVEQQVPTERLIIM